LTSKLLGCLSCAQMLVLECEAYKDVHPQEKDKAKAKVESAFVSFWGPQRGGDRCRPLPVREGPYL